MISPELLRRYPYFAPIQDATLKKLAMIAQEQTFPAGHMVFQEWQRADCLYVIRSGEVDVRYMLPGGACQSVDTLNEGDLLVWPALVPPYHTTGRGVTTRDTQVIAFEAAKLRELCDEDPQLGFRLMTQVVKLLAERLEGARVQLAVA